MSDGVEEDRSLPGERDGSGEESSDLASDADEERRQQRDDEL